MVPTTNTFFNLQRLALRRRKRYNGRVLQSQNRSFFPARRVPLHVNMVRPYAVKGLKRKREEEYDEEVEREEEETTAVAEEEEDGRKVGVPVRELPGIPLAPSNKNGKAGVIFALERACLEVGRVGKKPQLLNSDDHAGFLRKHGKNPAHYRPDIAYQAILAILDSPITKAGRLQALYVKTEKGVLFEVKPHTHMLRTFKQFCDLILELLQKLSVRAKGKREKLLRVIKNPVTQYLPLNSHKIGFSSSSEKLVEIRDYIAAASNDVVNLVFVVGAMAHGKIDTDYTDDFISVTLAWLEKFQPLWKPKTKSKEL